MSLLNKIAPPFSLPDTESKVVNLNDFLEKKVVLHFFPFAFTSVCTTQLCTARDNYQDYLNNGVEVLGVCTDSPYTLSEFKKLNQIDYAILSDYNRAVSKQYGVLYDIFPPNLKGVAKRSAFVISEEGIVLYEEILEDAHELPNFDAIHNSIGN